MKPRYTSWHELLDEMIHLEKQRLEKRAADLGYRLTQDDLLQPVDFHTLEYDPPFRYIEGCLKGLESAKTALLALEKETQTHVLKEV